MSCSILRQTACYLKCDIECNAVVVVFFINLSVPASLTSTPIDKTVREGDETTFHCTAIGNPTPNITWTRDGKTVGVGDTLRFKAHRNQSGKFGCSADNGLGEAVNASAYLNVPCKFQILFFGVNKICMWAIPISMAIMINKSCWCLLEMAFVLVGILVLFLFMSQSWSNTWTRLSSLPCRWWFW